MKNIKEAFDEALESMNNPNVQSWKKRNSICSFVSEVGRSKDEKIEEDEYVGKIIQLLTVWRDSGVEMESYDASAAMTSFMFKNKISLDSLKRMLLPKFVTEPFHASQLERYWVEKSDSVSIQDIRELFNFNPDANTESQFSLLQSYIDKIQINSTEQLAGLLSEIKGFEKVKDRLILFLSRQPNDEVFGRDFLKEAVEEIKRDCDKTLAIINWHNARVASGKGLNLTSKEDVKYTSELLSFFKTEKDKESVIYQILSSDPKEENRVNGLVLVIREGLIENSDLIERGKKVGVNGEEVRVRLERRPGQQVGTTDNPPPIPSANFSDLDSSLLRAIASPAPIKIPRVQSDKARKWSVSTILEPLNNLGNVQEPAIEDHSNKQQNLGAETKSTSRLARPRQVIQQTTLESAESEFEATAGTSPRTSGANQVVSGKGNGVDR